MTETMNHVRVDAPPAPPSPAKPASPAPPSPAKPAAAAPTVSVITPAFNAAATIDVTVASVLAQTDAAWELLIVDDGSSDDTLAKAQAWAARDVRVRVFAKTNGGPAAARNFGLAQARGAWLVFLDADDWLAPTFIADMLANAADADVLVAAHDRVGPAGDARGVAAAPALPDPFAILARRCPIVPVAAMVRAEIAHRVGGFDATVMSSEDWQFWQRAARLGARFRRVPRSLSSYRMAPGSLSRKTETYGADALRVIDEAFAGPDGAGDAADALDAKGGYLLYAAALAACGGGDPAAVFAHAPDLSSWSFDPAPWGEAVADLAAYAAAERRCDLTTRWASLEPHLERLYAALADVMGAPGHAARLQLHVRAQVLGDAACVGAPEAHGVRLATLDVTAAPRAVERLAAMDADMLVVAATARGRPLGLVEAPPAALADTVIWPTLARDLARRAPLKSAFAGFGARALAAAVLRSAADIDHWIRAGGVKRAAWVIATRALARRMSGAPLAVGGPDLAVILVRDRALPANGLPPRLAALAARGVRLVSGAEAAAAAEAGRTPRHRHGILAIDGPALGGGHPVFAAAPKSATVFAPAGAAGRALRADARHRGLRLGLRCLPEEGLARHPFKDAIARLAEARAEIDDPAPGILFAPGDVDGPTRLAARCAGFVFGVNPEPDVADFAQDPLSWRRLEVRAGEATAVFADRIGGLQ